jgi:shikimate dehydrogenase
MKLVVLGDPVAHSLSPALHTAAFASVRIAGTYAARRVDSAGMATAVGEIRRGVLDGANVTMPHKALAATLADRRSDTAARAGAANTLVRLGGDVVAHNTDIAGARYAASAAHLPDGPVLVLGAGGAAAAALLAFEHGHLAVSARRRDRAEALVSSLGVEAEIVPWGIARPGAVVVNATAIGMHGESLPDDVLDPAIGLLDMPYASGRTPASRAMIETGRPVAEGIDMLLGQAVAAFRLWTGRTPDAAAMRRALERAPTVQPTPRRSSVPPAR